MMLKSKSDCSEFNPEWVRRHGWKVVPAESMARISEVDMPRIVSVLNQAGCHYCYAATTESLGDLPSCYGLAVSEDSFKQLNRELGLFRFALTDEARSWAISCNEWYNLFAAPLELLEALLGKPIEQARKAYLAFASRLAQSPEDPLLRVEYY